MGNYIGTEAKDRTLEEQLCDILMRHVGERGDNEGAVECLERIVAERELLLRWEINKMFGKKP